jgi:hypothetical protein
MSTLKERGVMLFGVPFVPSLTIDDLKQFESDLLRMIVEDEGLEDIVVGDYKVCIESIKFYQYGKMLRLHYVDGFQIKNAHFFKSDYLEFYERDATFASDLKLICTMVEQKDVKSTSNRLLPIMSNMDGSPLDQYHFNVLNDILSAKKQKRGTSEWQADDYYIGAPKAMTDELHRITMQHAEACLMGKHLINDED